MVFLLSVDPRYLCFTNGITSRSIKLKIHLKILQIFRQNLYEKLNNIVPLQCSRMTRGFSLI